MIPIIIICKDRIRYLDTTLRGLSATVPSTTEIIIFNDGTTNHKMVEYLTTSNELLLTESEYPNENDDWAKRMSYVPNYSKITGIRDKISVKIYANSLGTRNMGLSIGEIFKTTNTSHVIKIEDDLIFKSTWYEKICDFLLCNPNIGILSGFRHFFGKNIKTKYYSEGLEELYYGYTGGLMLAVSRKLFELSPETFDTQMTELIGNENLWYDSCRTTGLDCCVSQKGLCQHIGLSSIVWGATPRKQFIINGHINSNRIDPDLCAPFSMSNEIKKFTSMGNS